MNKLETAIQESGRPLQLNEDGFHKDFIFTAEFIGFDGHFPGNPIVPGVVQLMAGAVSAMEAAGKQLSVKSVSRSKFLKQIGPDDRLTVRGKLKHKSDNIVASITIVCGDETAASFTLTMVEDHNE